MTATIATPASSTRRLFAAAAILACTNYAALAKDGGGSSVDLKTYTSSNQQRAEEAKVAEELAADLLGHVKGGKAAIATKIVSFLLSVDSSLGAPVATAIANAVVNASNAPAHSGPSSNE